MKTTTFIFSFALVVASVPVAVAQDSGITQYICRSNQLERRVELDYLSNSDLPCEVNYYKDNEAPGEKTTLWRAQNQVGYCEAKTAEFITKLESLGWVCGENSADIDTGATAE